MKDHIKDSYAGIQYIKGQQKTKKNTHESNNRIFVPFIEPLTPKSPLHYVSLHLGGFLSPSQVGS